MGPKTKDQIKTQQGTQENYAQQGFELRTFGSESPIFYPWANTTHKIEITMKLVGITVDSFL